MLAPFVIFVAIIYYSIARIVVMESSNKRRARLFAAVWAFIIFFGDHTVGYVWYRLATTIYSSRLEVAFSANSLAFERYFQDPQQQFNEGGDLCCYMIPVLTAIGKLRFIAEPIEYYHRKPDAYSLENVSKFRLSRIEEVDVAATESFQGRVNVTLLLERPDRRCSYFEALPEDVKRIHFQQLAKNGLAEPEKYCIGTYKDNHISAPYIFRQTDPGRIQSSIEGLFGVSSHHAEIVENHTGTVIAELKAAEFYGGWVSQAFRFFPDANYTLVRRSSSTFINPHDPSRTFWQVAQQPPYVVEVKQNSDSRP